MNALHTTTMPVSDAFKAMVNPIARAVGKESMERGMGVLLEHALDHYRKLHPDVTSPQCDFFKRYIKFVDESGLYRLVKGNGKKNRSFRVTADPALMIYVPRMRNKYAVLNRSRCTRLLLPLGIVIQPLEPLDGFTIDEPFKDLLGTIGKMLDRERKGAAAARV
jgi:hypothetical protein